MSGAAASSSPISICAAGVFRCGAPSPASVATRPPRSPSRPMSSARPAATTTTPTIRSRPISRRRAMRCMSRHRPMPRSIFATAPITRSKSGRFRSGSSCSPRRPSSRWSKPCPAASGASRRCRTGSITAPSSVSRMAPIRSRGSTGCARPASGCRACGARIGSASARPHSGHGCSGTGRRTSPAIPTFASASPNSSAMASASSAM